MLAFSRHERPNMRLEPAREGSASGADPTMAALSAMELSGRISERESNALRKRKGFAV